MAKVKTSKKQKKSLADLPQLKPSARSELRHSDPLSHLLDQRNRKLAIIECLTNGDKEGLIEVLSAFFLAFSVAERKKLTGIPSRTLYNALSARANPSMDVTVKLLSVALGGNF